MSEPTPLLEVRGLGVEFPGRGHRAQPVTAVNSVSFQLACGETLGLVGESGSGKSTIGNAVLGLVNPAKGNILFDGQDITHVPAGHRRELTHRIQVIFQDPYGSLNPSRTVGSSLAEPLRARRRLTRRDAATRVAEVLEQVGLPPDAAQRYPAQFSGGQRQRVAVARALIAEPDLVICDEPTSALDLSVQAQILNLLIDLQNRLGLAYLFISHDIDVVRHVSHRIAVLLNGTVVEQGLAEKLTRAPSDAYTKALLAAVPVPDPHQQAVRRRARSQPGNCSPPESETIPGHGTGPGRTSLSASGPVISGGAFQ